VGHSFFRAELTQVFLNIMSSIPTFSFTSAEIARGWRVHPTSVARIMARYGFSGAKFGTSRQSARRYAADDVNAVEKIAGFGRKSTAADKKGQHK